MPGRSNIARVADVAGRFGWSANWTRDVSGGGLALICLTAGKSLDGLTDEDFAVFARDLAAAPSAGPHTWTHNSSRAFSLHQACYELRICQQPPRQARPGKASLEQRAQQITQPGIRKAALRYLTTVASTLRPGTVDARADSLITFAEYLAARHPEVRGLTQLTAPAAVLLRSSPPRLAQRSSGTVDSGIPTTRYGSSLMSK